MISNETEAYRRDGYVALPGLFPVEVVQAFYAKMQSDFQVAGRPLRSFVSKGPLLRGEAIEIYAYQYPPMLTFLWGLTPRIAIAAGCELLPTYAYLRIYRAGDICRIHSDRLACEHSLSLTINYAEGQPWPLSIGSDRLAQPSGQVSEDFGNEAFGSVAMSAGDGVLYQGVHRRHGRLDPNPNSWSAHIFLHWVDRNGPYRDQAFDRPTIAAAQRAPSA